MWCFFFVGLGTHSRPGDRDIMRGAHDVKGGDDEDDENVDAEAT